MNFSPLAWFFLLSLLVAPVLGAYSTIDASLGSTKSIIAKSERYWQMSNVNLGFIQPGNQYIEGTTLTQVLTQGTAEMHRNETTDHRLNNVLDSSLVLSWNGGAVYGHEAYMGDQSPNTPDIECDAGNMNIPPAETRDSTDPVIIRGDNANWQEAQVYKTGMGLYGKFESDYVIENANLTSSTRAETGPGHYIEIIRTEALAGFDKNSSDLNYRMSGRDYYGTFGNESQIGYAVIDFEYKSHDNPYGVINKTVVR